MKIALSGASGLIGSALVPELEGAGHEVVRLVRRSPGGSREIEWDPASGWLDANALAGVEASTSRVVATQIPTLRGPLALNFPRFLQSVRVATMLFPVVLRPGPRRLAVVRINGGHALRSYA